MTACTIVVHVDCPTGAMAIGAMNIPAISAQADPLDDDHADWIQLHGLGVHATGPADANSTATLTELTVMRRVDRFSVALFEALVQEGTIPEVVIDLTSPVNARLYTVVLTDAMVTSFDISGGVGAAPAVEKLAFEFRRLEVIHRADDGTAGITAFYEIDTNTSGEASFTGPTDISLAPAAVDENSATDTFVGILSVADASSGDSHVLSLVESAGGRFKLNNNVLRVDDGTLLDHETAMSHTVQVRAQDSTLLSLTKTLTIAVSNLNESPGISTAIQSGAVTGEDHRVTGLAITDDDPGALVGDYTVTLTAVNGTLTLDETGLPPGGVIGNGGRIVTATAPATALNATFAGARGLVYRSNSVFTGIENLLVEVNDNGNTGAGTPITSTARLPIEVHVNALEEWRIINFTPAQLLDLDISGILGSADGGTRPNLIEFGLGTNPNDPGDEFDNVDIGEMMVGGQTHLTLIFHRRTTASDPLLSITPELAIDAKNWTSGPTAFVELSVTPLSSTFERVTLRSVQPKSALPRMQVRLVFDRQDPPQ